MTRAILAIILVWFGAVFVVKLIAYVMLALSAPIPVDQPRRCLAVAPIYGQEDPGAVQEFFWKCPAISAPGEPT